MTLTASKRQTLRLQDRLRGTQKKQSAKPSSVSSVFLECFPVCVPTQHMLRTQTFILKANIFFTSRTQFCSCNNVFSFALALIVIDSRSASLCFARSSKLVFQFWLRLRFTTGRWDSISSNLNSFYHCSLQFACGRSNRRLSIKNLPISYQKMLCVSNDLWFAKGKRLAFVLGPAVSKHFQLDWLAGKTLPWTLC